MESSCARRYAVVRRAGDGLRAALPDVPLARLALVAAAAGMRATAPLDVLRLGDFGGSPPGRRRTPSLAPSHDTSTVVLVFPSRGDSTTRE